MSKSIFLSLLLLASFQIQAQILNPVHWEFSASGKNSNHTLHLKARLDPGWHIYAQVQPEEAIAIPTQVSFAPNPEVDLEGKTREIGQKEKYNDPGSGIIQFQYENNLELAQTVHLKSKKGTVVKGTINYQVCTNEQCLPPKTIPFTITLH